MENAKCNTTFQNGDQGKPQACTQPSCKGDINKEDRKLFVGGITPETTTEQLKNHFSTYGDVVAVFIKMDPITGRSKGFAFISFLDIESVKKALSDKNHVINNRRVDVKKTITRTGKVFVGGLTPSLSDDDIRNHFSQFGKVIGMELPFDKLKNQRKSFGFIIFESETSVHQILKKPFQNINGKQVEVKRVIPKASDNLGSIGRGRAVLENAGITIGAGGYNTYKTSGRGRARQRQQQY